MTKRNIQEIAHEVARTLIRMADFRNDWVENSRTEAGRNYWREGMAEHDKILPLMKDLSVEERSQINGNLHHLNQAAVAGDSKAAAQAYDSAKEAGIFG